MTAEAHPEGLALAASRYDPAMTMELLVAAVTKRGMTVLARIDHAAAAAKAGLTLRPTEVLIFGNAKAGTPLMQSAQTIGIDLPLKALVFEDGDGKTWLAWNDPKWIAARHGANAAEHILETMASALAAIAHEAT
jgi:uncharacterized protein (DUF302 family)